MSDVPAVFRVLKDLSPLEAVSHPPPVPELPPHVSLSPHPLVEAGSFATESELVPHASPVSHRLAVLTFVCLPESEVHDKLDVPSHMKKPSLPFALVDVIAQPELELCVLL